MEKSPMVVRVTKTEFELDDGRIFDVSILPTLWKERAMEEGIKSWKELYQSLKKSKTRYRFLFVLDIFKGISFSLNSYKSLVLVHRFA